MTETASSSLVATPHSILPAAVRQRAYQREAGSVATWLHSPAGWVALLIAATLIARLIFAACLGLGIDESYMVAAGRTPRLSYFDHPPAAWWMAWGASHLAGTDAPVVVRLPFILLFALTTWLMFRLGSALFGTRAGLWSAILLNLAPVFGITTASWVLPDGPMLASLLGACLCLIAALDLARLTGSPAAANRVSWGWWLGAGACLGLALFSKYTAVLSAAGAVLFLLTEPRSRVWLRRPHPYAAILLALAVFSPVLVWNARHGWVSLLFQGGRAHSARLHPFGPLSTLAGEVLFLLPWIGLPLLGCLALALRRGPGDRTGWLLACLASPAIVLFLVVSVHTRVLFHWASPGYVVLLPLLGNEIGRRIDRSRMLRRLLGATAVLVVLGSALVASEVRFNWLPSVGEDFALGADPDLGAVDWISLRTELAERGWLAQPGLIVAATRWIDAGKADYALDGAARVVCLGKDPREYGIVANLSGDVGRDMLIIVPRGTIESVRARFGRRFDAIEPLPEITIRHHGRPAMLLPLFLGHRLHAAG